MPDAYDEVQPTLQFESQRRQKACEKKWIQFQGPGVTQSDSLQKLTGKSE